MLGLLSLSLVLGNAYSLLDPNVLQCAVKEVSQVLWQFPNNRVPKFAMLQVTLQNTGEYTFIDQRDLLNVLRESVNVVP